MTYLQLFKDLKLLNRNMYVDTLTKIFNQIPKRVHDSPPNVKNRLFME